MKGHPKREAAHVSTTFGPSSGFGKGQRGQSDGNGLGRQRFGAHPGLDAARCEIPWGRMSGDLLWFSHGCQSMTVGILDVRGHDEKAGRAAGKLWQFIAARALTTEPHDLLVRLNGHILRRSGDEGFDEDFYATALLARIDLRAERLTVWSAGHPRALLIQGGHVERIETRSLPLGVAPDLAPSPNVQPFGVPSALLLHSDGLLEARRPSGTYLGEEGLQSLVQRWHDFRPAAMVETLLDHLFGAYQVNDDLTICAVSTLSPDQPQGRELVCPIPVKANAPASSVRHHRAAHPESRSPSPAHALSSSSVPVAGSAAMLPADCTAT